MCGLRRGSFTDTVSYDERRGRAETTLAELVRRAQAAGGVGLREELPGPPPASSPESQR